MKKVNLTTDQCLEAIGLGAKSSLIVYISPKPTIKDVPTYDLIPRRSEH